MAGTAGSSEGGQLTIKPATINVIPIASRTIRRRASRRPTPASSNSRDASGISLTIMGSVMRSANFSVTERSRRIPPSQARSLHLIKGQVQEQYIDTLFAKESKLPLFGMSRDKLPNGILFQAASASNTA